MNRILALGVLLGASIILPAQSLKYQGYPSSEGEIDLRSNFEAPPKGYGNIPFYWWSGDTLQYERLLDQLSILAESATDGFSVSYIHTHPSVDIELNAQGYGGFGKADAGNPKFYTEEWWQLWNKFSAECAKRDIGLGVDDYVVGWPQNGFYVDEVLQSPDFLNYPGRLHCQSYQAEPGKTLEINLPENTLEVISFPQKEELTSRITEGKLKWTCPDGEAQKLYVISTTPSPELHPEYGSRMVDVYFNRFEKKLDEQGRKGLNYFFQDELHYNLNIHSWCKDMPSEFKKRKGYDILPYLPALWESIGPITPKIRLDYAQVATELAEERYFKPIFDWHNSRGLIYGCDNNGRGLDPIQYLDYFRAISWYTAPGNDAPSRGSSFRQTKVSSSVTHLYNRPRTWLEAFHSMGWDSNGEWLTSQLDHHLIAGGNLLCLHGLYYSTHGGWWEWAPPCFHFRMPYWPHMKSWLKYAQRMCFVLSQGRHVCDIAILYPTESLQAYPGSSIENFWKVSDLLSQHGLDYDFLDYQSIQHAEAESGELRVAGEKYKILILADIRAMHHETLMKIYDFHKKGGIVIGTGAFPTATTLSGEGNEKVESILKEVFQDKGSWEADPSKIPDKISSLIIPDFRTSSGNGRVLHRKIDNQDLYMVMNINKGEEIFFRAKGKLECWNAKKGTIAEFPILKQTDEGTWVKYDAEYNESKLFVFSPGEPLLADPNTPEFQLDREIPIEGVWDIEFIPTLNNKWGDFRLPAENELIGPEVREFSCLFIPENQEFRPEQNISPGSTTLYGYAPHMETITLTAGSSRNLDILSEIPDSDWKPYFYSWQYGVQDNPGSQGFHGLKGKVDNRFIILDQGGDQIFRTFVYAPQDGLYKILQEGVSPSRSYLDKNLIEKNEINLTQGWHSLLLVYENTPKGEYVLKDKRTTSVDERQRSALLFYPKNTPDIKENHPYDPIVAMKWFQTDYLPYSIYQDTPGTWAYRFQTAPGTKRMTLSIKGTLRKIWIDNKPVSLENLTELAQDTYLLDFGEHYQTGLSTVSILAEPERGYSAAAFFTAPIKLDCKGGKLPTGNWTDWGALKFYSGGINYTQNINLHKPESSEKIFLDLGKVNATCEVKINGKVVDILMQSPYRLDISDYVLEENNRIEVLVYSTLSNHYQSIPSAYRGEPISGLLGPVKISIHKIKS